METKRLCSLLAAAAMVVLTTSCLRAATDYAGSLSSTSGLAVGGSDWPGYSLAFSWKVGTDSTYTEFPWLYSYTFTESGIGSGVGHMVLETSESFGSGDYKGLSGASLESLGLQASHSGDSNMPENVYGTRLSPTGDSLTSWTFSFWSKYAPVWGDFYIRDGGNPTNYAYNLGFTDLNGSSTARDDFDPTAAPSNGSVGNHILRPGSTVPEPGTILAAITLLSPAALALRRKRK